MLTNIPAAVAASTRQVVLNHPNGLACTVWRKQVNRIDAGQSPGVMGDHPTLGGMGVLRTEDESDFQYNEEGAGRLLFAGAWAPNSMNTRGDAPLPHAQQEAQIVSTVAEGAGSFTPMIDDLVLLDLGLGVVIAFVIVDIVGSVNIPPYVQRYVLDPRDDLHQLDPFTGLG